MTQIGEPRSDEHQIPPLQNGVVSPGDASSSSDIASSRRSFQSDPLVWDDSVGPESAFSDDHMAQPHMWDQEMWTPVASSHDPARQDWWDHFEWSPVVSNHDRPTQDAWNQASWAPVDSIHDAAGQEGQGTAAQDALEEVLSRKRAQPFGSGYEGSDSRNVRQHHIL